MYVSPQGLQLIHQERVAAALARSERRRMLKEARDATAGTKRRPHALAMVLNAALGVLLRGHAEPACEQPVGAEK